MDAVNTQEVNNAYVVPRKQVPPPRGTRPLVGVVGNHAKKAAARRMLDSTGGGSIEDAVKIAAVSQKAEMDGKRRQIDIKELMRIAQEAER